MNRIFILVLIAEFCITIGQIFLKKSADRISLAEGVNKTWIIKLLEGILRIPTLWIGAGTMVVGLFFWFAALSVGELSYVYLLGSIQYIFALIAAYFFLYEEITTTKIIGTLLITLGIILTMIS